jgi:hypothetical protein
MRIVGNIAMGMTMTIIMLCLMFLLLAVIYPPIVNNFLGK